MTIFNLLLKKSLNLQCRDLTLSSLQIFLCVKCFRVVEKSYLISSLNILRRNIIILIMIFVINYPKLKMIIFIYYYFNLSKNLFIFYFIERLCLLYVDPCDIYHNLISRFKWYMEKSLYVIKWHICDTWFYF